MPDRHESDRPAAPWWRTPQIPTNTVTGRSVDEVAQLHRDDGFEVQVVDLDVNPIHDATFNTGRTQLIVRIRIVESASLG